jgi:DNA topoisomerase IB
VKLRQVDPTTSGYTRRRNGRGFVVLDEEGDEIEEVETLERIQALRIPPAWQEVWISPAANGHIQAVGTDAAGRRQYLYHAEWRRQRDIEKFDRMLRFAHGLPRLRERVAADLGREGLGRERVLATTLRLLDRGFFRIGGEQYADENESFGLATLARDHVRLRRNGTMLFDYTAKGGKRRVLQLGDADVRVVIASLKRRRGGSALFAYRADGRWRELRSRDVNGHLKELAGREFSAKDFRTWHATVLASASVALAAKPASRAALRRVVANACREVAHYLGNTPAVCRAAYIDPRVFERLENGRTIARPLHLLDQLVDEDAALDAFQPKLEAEVLRLLET